MALLDIIKKKSVVGGGNPVGCIITMMGNNAPDGYLKCDGTVYNIVDYPALANYFEDQFSSKNKFGGDGTTTFAVPNLQGEFLRGTGTNSYSGQGSGSAVGTHQNATEHAQYGFNSTANSKGLFFYQKRGGTWTTGISNPDVSSEVNNATQVYVGNSELLSGNADLAYTVKSRPTNTSVLYCIKY